MNTQIAMLMQSQIRVLFNIIVGYAGLYIMACTMLERRHSIWIMVAASLAKSLYTQFLMQLVMKTSENAVYLSLINALIFPVLVTIISLYTFRGSFTKVIPAVMISETCGITVMMCCFLPLNLIEGRADVLLFFGEFQWMDLFLFPMWAVVFGAFYFAVKPLLLRYRNWKPRHEGIIYCIFTVYVLSSMISYTLDYWNGDQVAAGYYLIFEFWIMIFFVISFLWIRMRKKNETALQNSLRLQKRLVMEHYTAVKESRIGQYRNVLGTQMEELSHLDEHEITTERIRNYLNDLKKSYEGVWAGVYCNDWAVDAVLYWQAEQFKKAGIRFLCSCQNYKKGKISEEDITNLLFQLLEAGRKSICGAEVSKRNVKTWAGEGEIRKKRIWENKERDDIPELLLTMNTVANQLFIIMEWRNESGRTKKIRTMRWFRKYERVYDGSMQIQRTKEKQSVAIGLTMPEE